MKMPTKVDDGSCTDRLFKKLYRVRVPRSLTLSKAEIELYGQRLTGIKNLDRYLANEMTTGRITTARMVEIIDMGGCIQFCDINDVPKVYGDVAQHLYNWNHILRTEYNLETPPAEDFEALKNFMDALDVYSSILDRKSIVRGKNPFKVYDDEGRGSMAKPIPARHYLADAGTQNNDIEIEHITSWEDLRQITR